MLGLGKTGADRAFAAASSARSRDADLYRRYAAVLYRQALLNRGDPVLAEYVVGDILVNEAALARISERGEGDARHRLTDSTLRCCQQMVRGRLRPARDWASGGLFGISHPGSLMTIHIRSE